MSVFVASIAIACGLACLPGTAQAANNIASANTEQQATGGSDPPAIVCDMLTIGDSIPPAPRTDATGLRTQVTPGEAIVQTTIVCSAPEDSVTETVTWTGVDPTPRTETFTETSPTGYTAYGDFMTDGAYGHRTFEICMHATAAGFSAADACNTLEGL